MLAIIANNSSQQPTIVNFLCSWPLRVLSGTGCVDSGIQAPSILGSAIVNTWPLEW